MRQRQGPARKSQVLIGRVSPRRAAGPRVSPRQGETEALEQGQGWVGRQAEKHAPAGRSPLPVGAAGTLRRSVSGGPPPPQAASGTPAPPRVPAGGGRRLGVPPLPLPDPAGARAPLGGGRGPAAGFREDLLRPPPPRGAGGAGVREWQIKFQPTSVRLLGVCVSCVQTRKAGSERGRLYGSHSDSAPRRGAGPAVGGRCVAGRALEGRDRVGLCLGSSSSRAGQSSPGQCGWGDPMGFGAGASSAWRPVCGATGLGVRASAHRGCESPHAWSLGEPELAATRPGTGVGAGSRLARGGAAQRTGRRRLPSCPRVGTGPRPCAPGQTRTGAASPRGADRG